MNCAALTATSCFSGSSHQHSRRSHHVPLINGRNVEIIADIYVWPLEASPTQLQSSVNLRHLLQPINRQHRLRSSSPVIFTPVHLLKPANEPTTLHVSYGKAEHEKKKASSCVETSWTLIFCPSPASWSRPSRPLTVLKASVSTAECQQKFSHRR